MNPRETDGGGASLACAMRHWHWRTVLIVFAVALVLRAGWGLYRMNTAGAAALEFPDEEQYWLMAGSLHDGAGLVDELGFRAGRMPLYPALLSIAAGSPAGIGVVRVAQWFVGALGAVFALMLGTRIGGRTVGILAGLMFAADPFLIFFSFLSRCSRGSGVAARASSWGGAIRQSGNGWRSACWASHACTLGNPRWG